MMEIHTDLLLKQRKFLEEKRNVTGDDDLFGFEQEVLSEKMQKLAVVKELVSTTCLLQENATANV